MASYWCQSADYHFIFQSWFVRHRNYIGSGSKQNVPVYVKPLSSCLCSTYKLLFDTLWQKSFQRWIWTYCSQNAQNLISFSKGDSWLSYNYWGPSLRHSIPSIFSYENLGFRKAENLLDLRFRKQGQAKRTSQSGLVCGKLISFLLFMFMTTTVLFTSYACSGHLNQL